MIRPRSACRRALLARGLAVALALDAAAFAADAPVPRTTQRSFSNADLAPDAPAPAAPAPAASGAPRVRGGREVVVDGGGEAALAQPTLAFELRDGRSGKTLTASNGGGGVADLLGGLRGGAILDTGASAHLLSAATARAYGVDADHGARYVETGVKGEHAMGVSGELDLALGTDRAARTFRSQRVLLNDAPSGSAALLLSPGSLADVVGMPALRDLVVVIDTAGAEGMPLDVRLAATAPSVDLWIATSPVDFSQRHHRDNRGELPTLAANPVIRDVRVRLGAKDARGEWLLDTGSAVTMISTAAAATLGLAAANGDPAREPAFRVPVGGIGGGHDALPGFVVDRIELAADDGRSVVFAPAAVVVHYVSLVRDDGTTVTLDGVLGMNLLLPSGSGLGALGFTHEHPSPFRTVVIDGPRARLGLAIK